MSIREIMMWYQNFISTDAYLVLNIAVIIFSFFAGKVSAIIMRPELSKKKYGELVELLEDDKNKLNESWKEAFTCLSKANTYFFLQYFFLCNLYIFFLLLKEMELQQQY